MSQFKLTLTKYRSKDFVETTIEASDYSVAYRYGEALASLMGTEEEYCPKLEKDILKEWHVEVDEVTN